MAMQDERVDWKHEFSTLTFITRGGNWLFLLLSRLGEPLMFLSVLYVVAETVLPGMFRASLFVSVSSASIIILNTAPEVILPGCFMQARQAQASHRWMYLTMGWVFIVLTFVTLASFIWQFSTGIVSIILFFRCAAGVLYSLLVRMTPQAAIPLPRVYEQQIETLSRSVAQSQASMVQSQQEFQSQLQQHLVEQLKQWAAFQQRQIESLTSSEGAFQFHIEERVSTVVQTLSVLSILPEMTERVASLEETAQAHLHLLANELSQVKARIEQVQALPMQAESKSEKRQSYKVKEPLHLPVRRADMPFDREQFVTACLEEDAEMKIAEIQRRAAERGQTISVGTISGYRKAFQKRFNETEIETDIEIQTDHLPVVNG